jgi:hypothetical protein
MSTSKFQTVLDVANAREPKKGASESPDTPTKRKVGKSKDPDYEQVTVYIRRDTHLEAKRLLLGQEIDFSELAEKLLSEWIAGRKPSKT